MREEHQARWDFEINLIKRVFAIYGSYAWENTILAADDEIKEMRGRVAKLELMITQWYKDRTNSDSRVARERLVQEAERLLGKRE